MLVCRLFVGVVLLAGVAECAVPCSMVTRDGRRMVARTEGTNVVYDLVKDEGFAPARPWRIYVVKATHTDIGLHNPQYVQRHGTVKRIEDAMRLVDSDSRGDDDPAAYRYVMEGTWFWENYPMDRGAAAAWNVVSNYVRRCRLDIACGCAGNHTHVFGPEELRRAALTKRRLLETWGVGTRTMLMADNPGLSWSIVKPFAEAGIANVLFAPNQWNPLPSTLRTMNKAIPAATWNPDARGGGAYIDVSYDSERPMVFKWQSYDRTTNLLVWCSTQYDHGLERLGIKSWGAKVEEVERRMPAFLEILERKYPYDLWLACDYGDDEDANRAFADFAAAWNAGTMILDATCSPSNVRFPQDFSLLNEAREKLDAMIDRLHDPHSGKRRPRTYRKVLRKTYLAMAKSKRRTARQTRSVVRVMLCAVKRNMDFVDGFLGNGGMLERRDMELLGTIRKLYAQQREMFDEKKHRVADRIVSVTQPFVRPIVRGKVKSPVEFGAKYDVSIDERGHARLEHIAFDPYNECTVLKDVVERYRERTGHYPKRVLVDQVYRTKENRRYCEERGIVMSGRKPGRPPADDKERRRNEKAERRNDADRIEVERFFSVDKRRCGAGLIMTKLSKTTLGSIALTVLVANLFGVQLPLLFLFYFMDAPDGASACHWLEIEDDAA